MDRQTLKPDVIYLIDYKPKSDKPDLVPRIKEGIQKAEADGFEYCYIIENDDYYPDDYFEKMQFNGYDFVGINKTIYYSLKQRAFSFTDHRNRIRSSLFCTGFKILAIEGFTWPADDFTKLDIRLWDSIIRKRDCHVFNELEDMPIGIKHGIGLCVTNAHKDNYQYQKSDKNLTWLKQHTRSESFEFYKSNMGYCGEKMTDKGTRHSFDDFYRMLFKDFKPEILFEIGTYKGGGLWFWHKMFPEIQLYGIDIKKYGNFEMPAGTTLIYEDIKKSKLDSVPNFDFIIDDGSHEFTDQKYVMKHLPAKLNKNGWLIIEDVPGIDVANRLVEFTPDKEKTFIVDRTFCRPEQEDEFLIIYRNI